MTLNSNIELNNLILGLAAVLLLGILSACDNNNGGGPRAEPITQNGLYTLLSSGIEREYYVQLPPDAAPINAAISLSKESNLTSPPAYARIEDAPPLLIALHGAGDSYEGWLPGGFQGDGLLQLAGEDAIVIVPNARANEQGRRIWDPGNETDYSFFLDLFSELDQRITYDKRRVFITGHSAGALMAHELGCRFGDIIRAIAPSAGSITSSLSPRCVGSVAVLQIQSEFDAIVPTAVVTDTRDLWVLYNGFDLNISTPGIIEPCIDYGLGASAYPVQWCLHDTGESDGHAWWLQADGAIWNFFSSLPIVEPTIDPPPGGGNGNLTQTFPTTMTVEIEFPADLAPIDVVGLFLYPGGSTLPISGAPQFILNGDIDLGVVTPGTRAIYDIPVKLPADSQLPNTYALLLAVYLEGGTFPIPTAGLDLNALAEVTIFDSTTPITVDEVLVLELIQAP
jgi:predicted esterase